MKILFAKTYESNSAKERIAKTIGRERANQIYYELLLCLKPLLRSDDWCIYFTGNDTPGLLEFLVTNNKINFRLQKGNDLGERLRNAAELEFSLGTRHLLFIGTDCPFLTPTDLVWAEQQLQSSDAVCLPAVDGGYVLIGLRPKALPLLSATLWSQSGLLNETLELAQQNNISVALGKMFKDIDTFEDYQTWKAT